MAFLEARSLSKRFPGVRALHKVSLHLERGEVLAVIGENGAGKSTLMKILAGVQEPDSGEIFLEDRPVRINSVRAAEHLGISLIHQELNLADNLDVASNIFLGREPRRLCFVNRPRLYADSTRFLDQVGLDCPARTLVSALSLGHQQMVEIAKALSVNARVLIMDEPTSSLSQGETDQLYRVVKELRTRGVSIVYISHRLGEVKELADRVLVLRDGENAGELQRDEITHDMMVKLMVGRNLVVKRGRRQVGASRNVASGILPDVEMGVPPSGSSVRAASGLENLEADPGGKMPPSTSGGTPDATPLSPSGITSALEVRGLRTATHPRHALNFSLQRGEIVGVAGLVGAGRTELLRVLFGIDPAVGGEVRVGGQCIEIRSPKDAIRAGLALVPEDRKQQGVILEMAVGENTTLVSLGRDARAGFRNQRCEVEVAGRMTRQLNVKTPNLAQLVQYLSGGNQQKVALAKWLAMEPRVLLLDEPTRGVDVGAKQEIYRLMDELAARGVAILFVSSEMEEVLRMSDRTLVMCQGRITGELSRDELSEEAVMRLATKMTNDQ